MNPEWNPGFSSSKTNAFISGTQALTSSLPFIVALVADFLTGDYWMILILIVVFFLPGTLLVTLCAWPYLIGDEFPVELYRIGFQILLSTGNGGLDVIADVFGAKQFHPVHHKSQLNIYFTWSLVMAGVGGVMAELVYSMIANVEVTLSFGIMFITLVVALIIFLLGSKRYIVRRQDKQDSILTAWAAVSAIFCWKKRDGQVVACLPGFNKVKKSRGGSVRDDLVTAAKRLFMVIPVQGLFVPVNVSLLQMVSSWLLDVHMMCLYVWFEVCI